MMRGMPREQVEANVERLRGGAADEAARELKLFFILQKIAAEQNVDVSEGELNGRIAMLADPARPAALKSSSSRCPRTAACPTSTCRCASRRRSTRSWPKAQIEEVELKAEDRQGRCPPPRPEPEAASRSA